MWGSPSLNFWGCLSQRHGWKEDSRAELNCPNHKAQGGWGVAPKSRLSPCQSQAAQILSDTALSALGASRHGGKQDFTRPGCLCRKHNAFPAPGPGRQPGRVQHASACSPGAGGMARCTVSSRISLRGSSSFSLLTCITPKMKHKLAEKCFTGRRRALCCAMFHAHVCVLPGLLTSLQIYQKIIRIRRSPGCLATYNDILLKAIIVEKW